MAKDAEDLSLDPDDVELTSREIRAVQLRQAGLTFDDIADALGYANRGSAWKAVRRALQKWGSETVDEHRALELSRLDTILRRIWPEAVGRPEKTNEDGEVVREAVPPDHDAIKTFLKISERRARLLGLDAPQELNIGGGDQPIRVEMVDDYEQFVGIIDDLRSQPGDVVDADVVDEDEDGGGAGGEADERPVLPPHADGEAE